MVRQGSKFILVYLINLKIFISRYDVYVPWVAENLSEDDDFDSSRAIQPDPTSPDDTPKVFKSVNAAPLIIVKPSVATQRDKPRPHLECQPQQDHKAPCFLKPEKEIVLCPKNLGM